MFPLVVDLTGRRVLVIGAGNVGVHKAAQLLECGARVTMISEHLFAPIPDGLEELLVRPYRHGDLSGAFLVVAATANGEVSDEIVREANELNLLINVVDDLARSNFFFTAVHRDGDVVVSVSTGGASPALAQWVRATAARALPTDLARVARQLRDERRALHERGESTEGRPWLDRVHELLGDSTLDDDASVFTGVELTAEIQHQG
jgi:precorrin-2 dehydrogenase/sirohydrochlorin ferrochelatase